MFDADAKCDALEDSLGDVGANRLRASVHAEATAPDTVLVSRGRSLFEIRIRDGRIPFVRDAVRTGQDPDALRVQPDGSHVYLADATRTVVAFRPNGLVVIEGHHEVSSWVTRRDGLGYSARLTNGRVNLATVIR